MSSTFLNLVVCFSVLIFIALLEALGNALPSLSVYVALACYDNTLTLLFCSAFFVNILVPPHPLCSSTFPFLSTKYLPPQPKGGQRKDLFITVSGNLARSHLAPGQDQKGMVEESCLVDTRRECRLERRGRGTRYNTQGRASVTHPDIAILSQRPN